MSDDQTTLSEFGDGDDVGDTATAAGDDAPPTPAANAADIERLVGLVGRLTDQVGDVVDELEQQDTTEYSAEDTTDTDPRGMFQ